jgi:8-oxo-dGTP pyrophosphatase MutT (NUDIX family)
VGTTKKPWNNKAAGILPYCKQTNRFLLFLRSPQIQDYSNTWATVGGKVDPSDINKYKLAALREMCEESKFCENIDLRLLYIFKDGTFSYRTYLGFVNEEFTPELNWENSDAKWVTWDQLVGHENLHPGFTEMIESPRVLELLEQHCR